MKVKQKRRGDEVEDGVEQEGGRKLGRGDTMFGAIRDRPSETNERTTLNGQQQGLGIGFRKAAWASTAFSILSRLLPAHSASLFLYQIC